MHLEFVLKAIQSRHAQTIAATNLKLLPPQLEDQEAVVILQKTPITEDSVAEMFAGSRLKLEMRNDIYSTYHLRPPAHLNGADAAAHSQGSGERHSNNMSSSTYLVAGGFNRTLGHLANNAPHQIGWTTNKKGFYVDV